MLLSLKNVSKTYKNKTVALSNVSFDVEKQQFISIIGPSGAGKSTLLRSINRLIFQVVALFLKVKKLKR